MRFGSLSGFGLVRGAASSSGRTLRTTWWRTAAAAAVAVGCMLAGGDTDAETQVNHELQFIGALGVGLAHSKGVDGAFASGRWSLRVLDWPFEVYGFGLEGGGFSHGFALPSSSVACGPPSASPCLDDGARNGGWIAARGMLGKRFGIVRPYGGLSLGVAWASRSPSIGGRTSWETPAVALLAGAGVDLWRFTLALEARGDAIDDVVDATLDLGLGLNF